MRPWERALLWLGVPMCVTGLVAPRMGTLRHDGRFAAPLVVSFVSFATPIRLWVVAKRQRIERDIEWPHTSTEVAR